MGSGYKQFTATTLTSSDLNNYCQNQSVMYFTSTTNRDTAISAPLPGMTCYIDSGDANEGLYTYVLGVGTTTGWRKSSWNSPWGVVGRALLTTAQAATTATLIPGSSLSIVQNQNRVYKYTVSGHGFWSAAGATTDGLQVAITNGAGTTYDSINLLPTALAATYAHAFSFTWYEVAGSSATVTRDLRVSRFAGTGGTVTYFADATRIGSFIVEDIGPSGAPA